jgi:spore maturation protein CgeB
MVPEIFWRLQGSRQPRELTPIRGASVPLQWGIAVRIVFFVHSLVSCWNHGNAHFLRGVVRELQALDHEVEVFEPRDGWSRQNLEAEQGRSAEQFFAAAFPGLGSRIYDLGTLDLDQALDGADLVVVHEWNEPALVAAVGQHRLRRGGYRLLFHDTHHRALTRDGEIAGLELDGYDGVLAFGEAVREIYLARGWGRRVWTWHEAADVALFRPLPNVPGPWDGDLVWIGNWGDDERSAELQSFLLEPIRRLSLRARIHGVRYPDEARARIRDAGAELAGWLPNHHVPEVFSRYRVTVHVPRRPYVQALPGIPTIRVFEALACGIPLVCSPWSDVESLFRPGQDFLMADDTDEMCTQLNALLADADMARAVAANGLERIRQRHTCSHRANELLAILADLDPARDPAERPSANPLSGAGLPLA